MTMSVIVGEPETGKRTIYVKGAYEKISTLCTHLPQNYKRESEELAKTGHYVLTMACRKIDPSEDVMQLSRDDLESKLLGCC